MPEKTLFIVQQFERRGRKLTAGRSVEYRTSEEAVARAGRDAEPGAGHLVQEDRPEVIVAAVLDQIVNR